MKHAALDLSAGAEDGGLHLLFLAGFGVMLLRQGFANLRLGVSLIASRTTWRPQPCRRCAEALACAGHRREQGRWGSTIAVRRAGRRSGGMSIADVTPSMPALACRAT